MRIRKKTDLLEEEDIELIAKASDAFAHPARVILFRYIYTENLSRKKVCNKDLVEEFEYSQATISQHMSKLVSSGLIEMQKEGTKSYYYTNIGMLGRYLTTIRKLNERPGKE